MFTSHCILFFRQRVGRPSDFYSSKYSNYPLNSCLHGRSASLQLTFSNLTFLTFANLAFANLTQVLLLLQVQVTLPLLLHNINHCLTAVLRHCVHNLKKMKCKPRSSRKKEVTSVLGLWVARSGPSSGSCSSRCWGSCSTSRSTSTSAACSIRWPPMTTSVIFSAEGQTLWLPLCDMFLHFLSSGIQRVFPIHKTFAVLKIALKSPKKITKFVIDQYCPKI